MVFAIETTAAETSGGYSLSGGWAVYQRPPEYARQLALRIYICRSIARLMTLRADFRLMRVADHLPYANA